MRQLNLVFCLYLLPLALKLRVPAPSFNLLQQVQVPHPLVFPAQSLCKQFSKLGIRLNDPLPLAQSYRYVAQLSR